MQKAVLLGIVGCTLACGPVTSSSNNTSVCSLASYSATPTTDASVGIASGNPSSVGLTIAQQFLNTAKGTATSASAALQKTGTFTAGSHTLIATIESDKSGSPDSAPLATSVPLDPSVISSTTPSVYSFVFTQGAALSANQVYWLRIRASYAVNSTNYISWLAFDGKTGGYFNGTTPLNGAVETNVTNQFSTSSLGQYRFFIFRIGC